MAGSSRMLSWFFFHNSLKKAWVGFFRFLILGWLLLLISYFYQMNRSANLRVIEGVFFFLNQTEVRARDTRASNEFRIFLCLVSFNVLFINVYIKIKFHNSRVPGSILSSVYSLQCIFSSVNCVDKILTGFVVTLLFHD